MHFRYRKNDLQFSVNIVKLRIENSLGFAVDNFGTMRLYNKHFKISLESHLYLVGGIKPTFKLLIN